MLDDTVAIVTGGSTGIGKATAAKYKEYGATVVIANRSGDAGREAAAELDCEFVQCDVSDHAQVEALVEATVEEFDSLDALLDD